MILDSFGLSAPTAELRDRANRFQGTSGPYTGFDLGPLKQVAESYGLQIDELPISPATGYREFLARMYGSEPSRWSESLAGCPTVVEIRGRGLMLGVELNRPSTHLPATALEKGEQVKLSGFGVFQVRAKRARMGRNPKTGEPAAIEPRRVIGFRASQVMKARVDRALSR